MALEEASESQHSGYISIAAFEKFEKKEARSRGLLAGGQLLARDSPPLHHHVFLDHIHYANLPHFFCEKEAMISATEQ